MKTIHTWSHMSDTLLFFPSITLSHDSFPEFAVTGNWGREILIPMGNGQCCDERISINSVSSLPKISFDNSFTPTSNNWVCDENLPPRFTQTRHRFSCFLFSTGGRILSSYKAMGPLTRDHWCWLPVCLEKSEVPRLRKMIFCLHWPLLPRSVGPSSIPPCYHTVQNRESRID